MTAEQIDGYIAAVEGGVLYDDIYAAADDPNRWVRWALRTGRIVTASAAAWLDGLTKGTCSWQTLASLTPVQLPTAGPPQPQELTGDALYDVMYPNG